MPRGWTYSYAITCSFLRNNLAKRDRIKRQKRPCFYYSNSSAAFNMELIGDLTFKRNPGPFMNRAIPILVSSQAKCSHSSRLTAVSHNVTPDFKNRCLRGVNWNNVINIRYSNQKLQDGFVPIDFCLLNIRSINKKELAIKDYAVDNNVDIFAMTETWLRDNENYNFFTAEVCPTGYCFYHVPRNTPYSKMAAILVFFCWFSN